MNRAPGPRKVSWGIAKNTNSPPPPPPLLGPVTVGGEDVSSHFALPRPRLGLGTTQEILLHWPPGISRGESAVFAPQGSTEQRVRACVRVSVRGRLQRGAPWLVYT